MEANLVLESCGQDEALRSDLQVIADQASRCKRIVSELLDFSRQNRIVRKSINIREVVG